MMALIVFALLAILYLFLLLLEKLVALRERVKKLSWELSFLGRLYKLTSDSDELGKLPLSRIEELLGITETKAI